MSTPGFHGVLETSLYHPHEMRERMVGFYGELLGMQRVAGWEDGVAFRAGAGVLLLFDRDRLAERQGPIAEHGSVGPGHLCLLADPGAYAAWKERLREGGVEVTHEHEWSSGRRSFYFQDPAGNLVEIADGDLWPAAPASA
jgi:catechol 2,3-dioxygenase-like lactoylglutathione lyase family enzyme